MDTIPEPSPLAASLLRAQIDSFAERHCLTPREHDMVFLLATGHGSVPVIAGRLHLSPNTVHNHFKNVFRRTQTRSKTEVLALLFNESLMQQAREKAYVRRPRVLIVGGEPSLDMEITTALQSRGMLAYVENNGERAIERVGQLRIDAVVVDAARRGPRGQAIATEIADRYDPSPLVVGLADVSDVRPAGGALVLMRPVSAEQIVYAVLEHVMDSPYDQSRLQRVDVDLEGRLNGAPVRLSNLGFGGAFVVHRPADLELQPQLTPGARVELAFSLGDRERLVLRSEVVWRRALERPSRPSGIGVRFDEMGEPARSAIEEFVRHRKVVALSGDVEIPSGRRRVA